MERPILFSGPMVKAILEGRKTMTRRVIKPQPQGDYWEPKQLSDGRFVFSANLNPPSSFPEKAFNRPYGQPGDKLWVREAYHLWAVHAKDAEVIYAASDGGHCYIQLTEEAKLNALHIKHLDNYRGFVGYHPSIHMPRWASRITLEVVSVRVERVQDITEEDARAEGIYGEGHQWATLVKNDAKYKSTARLAFSYLWNSINAKRGYSWESNPWVWVVEFKRVEVNP